MPRMSRVHFLTWLVLTLILASVLTVLSQSTFVEAAPVDAPLLGITPTVTATQTPTSTPTSTPTATPAPRDADSPIGQVDPAIVKRGDPSEAVPGEMVRFTLEVTNHGTDAAVGVVVTDEVSEYLEILDVTTTQGTVAIDGQKVTVEVGVVGPGFIVEIVIETRVRADTPAPLEIENLAILTADNSTERTARAVVAVANLALPITGNTERSSAVSWAAAAVLLALIGFGVWEGIASRRNRRTL